MTIVDHCRAEAQHLTPPLRSLPGKTLQCFWVFAESAVSPSSSAESEGPTTTTHRKLSVLLVTSLLLGGPIYIWATWYQVSHTTLCSLLGAALLWCNRHTGQCNSKVSWVFRSDINNGQQLALLCFVFFPLTSWPNDLLQNHFFLAIGFKEVPQMGENQKEKNTGHLILYPRRWVSVFYFFKLQQLT